jgi:CcmD family protein
MENSGFLFGAYTVIWALVFAYVFFLVRRQSDLRRRLDSLEGDLKKKPGGQPQGQD